MKRTTPWLHWTCTLALALLAGGCSCSEENAVERGLETGHDVAVPESSREMAETEAERRSEEIQAEEDRALEDEAKGSSAAADDE